MSENMKLNGEGPALSPEGGMSRRGLLKLTVGGLAAAALTESPLGAAAAAADAAKLKGNIHHAVCKWCYKMSTEELAQQCVRIGIKGMDLVDQKDWPILKKYNLVCSMAQGGLNDIIRKENQARLVESGKKLINDAAAAGWPNVIALTGQRKGMADEEGLKNATEMLKQIASLAEQKNVTVCVEILNSKRDHKDYMFDRMKWGTDLCKAVGSPRVKILYDIYHDQIMEGDVIATIRENFQYIGHFHTGGVPGRNEIDETQELNYPAIMRAILKLKYEGFVAQEFLPKRDPATSLEQAIRICDI